MFDLYYIFEDSFELVDTFATKADAEAVADKLSAELIDTYAEGYEVTAHGELPV